MFPLLLKDSYHKPEAIGEGADVDTAERKAAERDFLDDEQIKILRDQELVRTLLPSKYATDGDGFPDYLAQELAKSDGMKNSKPDYTFGTGPQTYPYPEEVMVPRAINTLLEICPGIINILLIVEGKADRGSQAEAENQARRGGATIVNSTRMLREAVSLGDITTGADRTSFVFSVTMSPLVVDIWVHWYEISTALFHMNLVASYTYKTPQSLNDIRQMLHNILQRGANDRFVGQEDLYNAINQYARDEMEKQRRSKNKRKGKSADKESTPFNSTRSGASSSNDWSIVL